MLLCLLDFMQPLCVLVDDEKDVLLFKDYKPSADVKVPSTQPQPASPAPTPSEPTSAHPPPTSPPSTPPTSAEDTGRVLASPYAKTLASAQDIDLAVRIHTCQHAMHVVNMVVRVVSVAVHVVSVAMHVVSMVMMW